MKEHVVEPIEGLIVGHKGDGRCIYSAAGKRALIHACLQPGISVAGSALVNGVNANLLRKWIRQFQSKQQRGHRPSGAAKPNHHPLVPLLPIQLTDIVPHVVDPKPMKVISERAKTITNVLPRKQTTGCIGIEIAGAKLTLRGDIDEQQLRLVLSCLAHSYPVREAK